MPTVSRPTAASMVVAPTLLALSTVAYVLGNGLGADSWGGAIQVYACTAFALVFVGTSRAVEPAAPRLATVLLLIGILGAAGGVGYGIQAIHLEMLPVRLDADGTGAVGALALNLPGILFPAALATLGIAVWRLGMAPAWAGLLTVVGAVAFPVSRIGGIGSLALAADLILLIGLVGVATTAVAGKPAVPGRSAPAPGSV